MWGGPPGHVFGSGGGGECLARPIIPSPVAHWLLPYPFFESPALLFKNHATCSLGSWVHEGGKYNYSLAAAMHKRACWGNSMIVLRLEVLLYLASQIRFTTQTSTTFVRYYLKSICIFFNRILRNTQLFSTLKL